MENTDKFKIIGGDFNLTLDIDKDRLNTYSNNNNSKNKLLQIMEQNLLEDIWRVRNENEYQFTWFKKDRNSEPKASRLDFFLTSKGLNVENVTFCPATYTDHRAVVVVIKCLMGKKRGTGYWKFNTKLLRDKDFLVYMNGELNDICNKSHTDYSTKWQQIKEAIKKKSQNYTQKIRKEDKIAISQLFEKIDEMQNNMPLSEQNCHI